LDVVSIRYLAGLLWSAVAFAIFRPPLPDGEMVKAHSFRAIFYVGTSFLFFYAISVLPMVETMVFTYVAPIFMAILGRFLLKEKVPASTALADFLVLRWHSGHCTRARFFTRTFVGKSARNFRSAWLSRDLCARQCAFARTSWK